MAGMAIVGKVALKVWPDLRYFKEDLRKGVKEATAGVKAMVEVDFDRNQIREALRNAIRDVNASIRGDDRFQINIPVDVDDMRNVLRDEIDDLNDILDAKLAFEPHVSDEDLEKFHSDLDNFLTAMEVTVPVTPEPAKGYLTDKDITRMFFSSVPKVKVEPELDELKALSVKARLALMFDSISVNVKATLSEPSVVKVRAALMALAKAPLEIKVKPVLDNKAVQAFGAAVARISGMRLLQKKIMAFDFLKDLDLALPRIALISNAIGSATLATVGLLGGILAVGRGLAQIVPAALALPGIFAGMVTEAASFGMALAEINKRFPDLKNQLSGIKDANNNAFWAQATTSFQALTSSWIPKFVAGMKLVGTASGETFAALTSDLHKVVTSRLPDWFAATAKGIDNFRVATPAIANIVKHFGDLGAIYFPRLTTAMASSVEKFSEWLDLKDSTGELTEMIELGITRIKELWRVVTGLSSVLSGLSKAAEDAGYRGLGGLADGLHGLAATIKSTKVHDLLVDMFTGAKLGVEEFMKNAAPGLEKFFTNFVRLLRESGPLIGEVGGLLTGAIGSFLGDPKVRDGVDYVFLGMRDALKELEPALGPLAEGFKGLGKVVGTAFKELSPIMEDALSSVGDASVGLLNALDKIIPPLAGGLKDVLDKVKPAFDDLMPSVNDFVTKVGTDVGDFLKDIAPDLGEIAKALSSSLKDDLPIVASAFGTLKDRVVDLTHALTPAAEDAIRGTGALIGYLAGQLDALLSLDWSRAEAGNKVLEDNNPALTEMTNGANAALGELWRNWQGFVEWMNTPWTLDGIAQGLDGVATSIGNWVIDIGTQVANIGTSIAEGVSLWWSEVGPVFDGFFASIANWWNNDVVGFFTGDGGEGGAGGGGGGAGAQKPALINLFGLPGVLAALNEFGPQLQAAWDGIWQGITITIPSVMASIAANVVLGLQGAVTSAQAKLGEMEAAFGTAWTNIRTTVITKLAEVGASIASKMTEAKTSITNAWNDVVAKTTEAWNSFASTIKAKGDEALGFLRGLPGQISGIFAGLPGTLRSIGASIMDSFLRGLQSVDVLGWLRNLTAQIPANKGPASVDRVLLTPAGELIMQSLLDGFKSGFDDVRKFLHWATDEIGSTEFAMPGVAASNTRAISSAYGEGATGGGDTYNEFNLTVPVNEIKQVKDLTDFADELRRRHRASGR